MTDRDAQAELLHSLPRIARSAESATEWAGRCAAEAARADTLAAQNAALAAQIAELTALLQTCTRAYPRSPATADAAPTAVLVVGPPNTAALPGAGPARA